MRIFEGVPVRIVAMACFAVGFVGTLVSDDTERAAVAASPGPGRTAPLFDRGDVFRAEVSYLCRRHTDSVADNRGLWQNATDEDLRRLHASVSKLRIDGLRSLYPPSARERRLVARIDGSLREIESLADEAAHAGADNVIDQAFREDVVVDLQATLRSLSGLAEDQGMRECALS